MRIKESLFLFFSLSLSLLCIEEIYFIYLLLARMSCLVLNKQRRRKVLIRYDTIRCAEMQLPGGVDKSRQILIDARE